MGGTVEKTEKRYELTELLALMKANKIVHLKLGGMELEMHPSAFEAESSTSKPKALFDEDLPPDLLYAAGIQLEPAAEEEA